MSSLSRDVALVQAISAVPAILDVVCRTTGMGFAAVARVTESRWVACSVLDHIGFGLQPGGELELETTICHEIRQSETPVIIDHVSGDDLYRHHHTPLKYGFESYISVPIFLPGGRFFGTLCCIDPKPARLNVPEITGMFKLFAELIAFHIDTVEKLALSESKLLEAREASVLREQFIGVLGHDLRNPLGALSMGTMLLKESELVPEDRDTVAMMERSVSRMSGLIDDVVDFTRGRLGGGITLGEKSVKTLEPVLRQVIEEVQAQWPERRIETDFTLEEKLRFDPKRMAQLFANLLSNAMAHGKPGSAVTVRAVAFSTDSRSAGQGGDGGGSGLELSVSNEADPIPPEIQARLFEPFSRGDSTTYKEGLGLGLYIAAEIAKSHGGTLTVFSTPEETRFTFSMPGSPA